MLKLIQYYLPCYDNKENWADFEALLTAMDQHTLLDLRTDSTYFFIQREWKFSWISCNVAKIILECFLSKSTYSFHVIRKVIYTRFVTALRKILASSFHFWCFSTCVYLVTPSSVFQPTVLIYSTSVRSNSNYMLCIWF